MREDFTIPDQQGPRSFLLFFALAVLGSIFFTAASIGKLTNLWGGAVIGGIGGAMALKGPRPGPKQLR